MEVKVSFQDIALFPLWDLGAELRLSGLRGKSIFTHWAILLVQGFITS